MSLIFSLESDVPEIHPSAESLRAYSAEALGALTVEQVGPASWLLHPHGTVETSTVDRDLIWAIRRDLAVLALRVGQTAEAPDLARCCFSILAACLPEHGLSHQELNKVSWDNSQRSITEFVKNWLAGSRSDGAFPSNRPGWPGYSHVELFGALYAEEIRTVRDILQTKPLVKVLDIGAGDGHFSTTLFALLTKDERARVLVESLDFEVRRSGRAATTLRSQGCYNWRQTVDDVTRSGFADDLRRRQPDVIIANHVLEHLHGDVQHLFVDDWAFAAAEALCLSVPFGDDVGDAISGHVARYSLADVKALSEHLEVRTSHSLVPVDTESNSELGLCIWRRDHAEIYAGSTALRLEPRVSTGIELDSVFPDFSIDLDLTAFNVTRSPTLVGRVMDERTFSGVAGPRQGRQLVVKTPGSDVLIPEILSKFSEPVQLIIDHNRSANAEYDSMYAYLSFFQGNTNFGSYRGLSLNCHTDQMQSVLEGAQFRPDWSYIVSDTLPTSFFVQPFDIMGAVAAARRGEPVNLYDVFAEQASLESSVTAEAFGVYLLSPYMVHAASIAEHDVDRVFMKIAFSRMRFFDNRELRQNLAFETSHWSLADTVGYRDGFFSHAHWNERFLARDVPKGITSPVNRALLAQVLYDPSSD